MLIDRPFSFNFAAYRDPNHLLALLASSSPLPQPSEKKRAPPEDEASAAAHCKAEKMVKIPSADSVKNQFSIQQRKCLYYLLPTSTVGVPLCEASRIEIVAGLP